MNKNYTNSSSANKSHNNARNDHINSMKVHYLKGGLPPLSIWSLALTSIFCLFLLYSPTPFLSSSRNDSLPHNAIPLIPSRKDFGDGSTKEVTGGTTPNSKHIYIDSVGNPVKPKDIEENKCDLFKGKWAPVLNVTHYTSTSCKSIPDSKNCFKHGREDRDFLNWRWKPDACELPLFSAVTFLRIVRGKTLGFIGDSVARNHMESLLCLLSEAETPTDVYQDSEDRFRTWHFPSSNFTLMIFWSKFLVKSEERMVNNSGTGSFNLHLDQVDEKWASHLPDLDYTIISTAHWFFRQNYLYDHGNLIGCVYCNEPNVTAFELNHALRMSLRGALKHVNKCKGCKKAMLTLVRTFSPAHFENGAWNTGGTCNRTSPYNEEMAKGKTFELELGKLQVEELERARKDGEVTGLRFRSLDVTRVMLMRPDGHPGEHWGNKWMQGYNDCVHWCLPGPIDVWNDFLLAVMQKEVESSQLFPASKKIQA